MKQLCQNITFIIFAFLLTFIKIESCHAQNNMTWEDFVTYIHEKEELESIDEEIFYELQELHDNPININTATQQDLDALPFLSTNQITDILYYRDKNGAILSLGELMLISSLDIQTREALKLFCYAGDVPPKNNFKSLFQQQKNDIVARGDIPLYNKAAYKNYPTKTLMKSPNKIYLGNKYYCSTRYSFQSAKHLYAGIQMEKDAGERNIDYLSWYAMIKDIGIIKNATIGSFKANFGQGLVVNTGTSYGKTMMTGNLGRIDKGFTKHSSTSESNYFTGLATTLQYNNILISTYISHRKEDGTLNSDSSGVTTITTNGLHRTISELNKKDNIGATDIGGNIHININNLQLSATAAYTHFSIPLKPKYNTRSSLYRLYNAQGNDFAAYSISYSYRGRNITTCGETAISNNMKMASINNIQWDINTHNSVTASYRYYSYKYVTINGKSFSENNKPQNENAIYFNWNTDINTKLHLFTYIDLMYFPWLKYQVSSSSYGIDYNTQITYKTSENTELLLQYKIKAKQKDYTYMKQNGPKDTIRSIIANTRQSIKMQCRNNFSPYLNLKSTLYGVRTDFANKHEYGFAITEALQWHDDDKKKQLCINATYFNTDSYDTRIYNYEPNLLYTFGMTSYYHKGIRLCTLASFPITKNLFVTAKAATTIFFDLESIGSDTELISSNHKEDIQMQIRWKL